MNTLALEQYSTVTEQPGQQASVMQLTMMATRYAWARSFAVGKHVLEAACGAGTGLGILAEVALSVDAGDIDSVNLEAAARTYARDPKVRIQRLDAMDLPFPDASLDLVLLFEAIYYLPDAGKFFGEAWRVLRPGGRLLISTVNPQWAGFNPSPFHTRYLTAGELHRQIVSAGFVAEIKMGFPERESPISRVVDLIRRLAVAMRLVPRTMAGKTFLKRLFYGRLRPIPARLDLRRFAIEPLEPWRAGPEADRHRVLYVAARKTNPADSHEVIS